MTAAVLRFTLAAVLFTSLSACFSETTEDDPVAVVLKIELSADGLLVDGEAVSISGLSQLLKSEASRQPTFASVHISGDAPVSRVNDVMTGLRGSDVLGVHYAADSPRQAFYPVTL